MCGIAGLLHSSVTDPDYLNAILNKMGDKLEHRGPDESNILINHHFALIHKRLSIIDIQNGHQPMQSPCGRYTLIFNGEIYNYLELRQELALKGCVFKTSSDTEVLLHMLITYQEKALNKLNGMFAFVFYDSKTHSWLMARDHFGVKPLYYAIIDKQLLFASEIKALLVHPDVKRQLNSRALDHYFIFQFYLQGETLFQGVHELEPASFIQGRQSHISPPQKYWKLDYTINYEKNENEFETELLSLLQDSHHLQVRSDVSLGAYLSGGLDSSIVSVLASKQSPGKIPLFCGRFLDAPGYDESSYAKMLADKLGSELFLVEPTVDDFIHFLPKLIESLDQPVAGPGVFPQYLVSQLASKHVKVVLGGQGGDELFGGYARYLVAYFEQALKGAIFESQEEGHHIVTLDSIVPNLALLKQYQPMMQNFWMKGLFDSMDRRYFHLIDRSPNIESWLDADRLELFDKERAFADFQKIFNEPDTISYINKMTSFDMRTLLPALLQVEDRVSMAASIEARVPLLDKRIAELIASMPPALKFQGGKTKSILKQAAKNLLPEEILNRKDKMGFPVPLNSWWSESKLKEFVSDVLRSKKGLERGIFDKQKLLNISDHLVFDREMWGILSLELWFKQFIDN